MESRSFEASRSRFTPPPEDPHAAEPTKDVISPEEREVWDQYAALSPTHSAEAKARLLEQFHAAKIENTEQNFTRTIARGDLVTAFDQIAYFATHGGAPETLAAMEHTFSQQIQSERDRLRSRTEFSIASGGPAQPTYDKAVALRQRQEQFLSRYEEALQRRQYDTPVRFELTAQDVERHARSTGKLPEEIERERTATDTDPIRRRERLAAVQQEILPSIMARATRGRIDVLTALDALKSAQETTPALYPSLRAQFLDRLAQESRRLRAREALTTQPVRRALTRAWSGIKEAIGVAPDAPETYTYQQLDAVRTVVLEDAAPFSAEH